MLRAATSALFAASLLSACSLSVGSKPTTTPEPSPDADTATPDEGTATSADADAPPPEDAGPKTTATADAGSPEDRPPAAEPASFAEGLAALDPATDGAFADAVALFIKFHPVGRTRASTVRMNLQAFVAFVEATGAAADAKVRDTAGLRAAACQSAGFDCGEPSKDDIAAIEALRDRGIRYAYAGEGTMSVAVDHEALARALAPALDDASAGFLQATHATTLLAESFDEGSFTGKPKVALDALLRWEALAKSPGPYAAEAPQGASAARETYLRLCFDGEYQRPPCQANKALRASYARFAKAHADSPSAPAVAWVHRALRGKGWKASAAELDAIVTKALALVP